MQTERDAPTSEVLDGGLFFSPTRFAGAPSQRGPCKSLHSCDRGYHFGKEEIPAADFGGEALLLLLLLHRCKKREEDD